MTKASTDSSRGEGPKVPAFLGTPLFIESRKHRSDADHRDNMRLVGEELVRFANGATYTFETSNGSVSATEEDRQTILRWLSKVPKLPPKMLTEISRYAGMIEPGPTVIHSAVRGGRVFLLSSTTCLPPSSVSALGYLVAILSYFEYLDSFGRCPECGVWFFDIPSGRPMKKYCSPEHSNRHRQRKYRQKRK